MHNLHFILFTTLIQHLYKEKKRKNDDIYALFMTKYIIFPFDRKKRDTARSPAVPEDISLTVDHIIVSLRKQIFSLYGSSLSSSR